jgi:hypothetical protein
MPGQLCNGKSLKSAVVRDSKAFCEGYAARAASAAPVNPHEAGSDAAKSFNAGAAVKAGETVGGEDCRCCAPSGPPALAVVIDSP